MKGGLLIMCPDESNLGMAEDVPFNATENDAINLEKDIHLKFSK